MGVGAAHKEFWDELARESEPLDLGVLGVTAQVPGVTARALLVGLHAASHGPVGTALADLQRALEKIPHEVWGKAAALARRLEADAAFAVGLSLVPQGAELARRLGLDASAPAEILLSAAAPPPTTGGWEWFAQAPGLRGKLRFALGKLAPTRDFMRVVDPIGQRGGPWLAVAYVIRPFRLALQAPEGFRAWRHTRRRASS